MNSQKLKAHLEAKGVHPDAVRKKGDTQEIKFGYFYTHGRTSDGYAASVEKALPAGMVVVSHRNDWKAWPKDSNFVVVVKQS